MYKCDISTVLSCKSNQPNPPYINLNAQNKYIRIANLKISKFAQLYPLTPTGLSLRTNSAPSLTIYGIDDWFVGNAYECTPTVSDILV